MKGLSDTLFSVSVRCTVSYRPSTGKKLLRKTQSFAVTAKNAYESKKVMRIVETIVFISTSKHHPQEECAAENCSQNIFPRMGIASEVTANFLLGNVLFAINEGETGDGRRCRFQSCLGRQLCSKIDMHRPNSRECSESARPWWMLQQGLQAAGDLCGFDSWRR